MQRRSPIRFSALGLLALALMSRPVGAAVSLPSRFVDDLLVSGLNQPNSMAFLPDGRLLITEQRSGRVKLFVNGHLSSGGPVLTLTDVNVTGYERGLHGIAVDPRWPVYPYVYLNYNRVGGFCRLVRFTAAGELVLPGSEDLVLYNPLVLIDDIPDNSPNHNVGALRFGSGGKLFMDVGDDEDLCSAADSTSLKGAVLRLDIRDLPPDSGMVVPRFAITPTDNPLATSNANARLVWAYGMRNPWRFDVDSLTDNLYVGDPGETDFEEMDEVMPGDYLGWPYREGNKIMTPIGCTEPGGPGANNYKAPIYTMAHGAGPTAIICAGMYRPSATGSFNWPTEYYGTYGDVFFGEYYSGVLRRLKRQAGQWGIAAPVSGQPDSQNWATGLIAEVDFRVGPDGSLWWLSQFDATFSGATGTLHRIRYTSVQADVPPGGARLGGLTSAPNPFMHRTDVSFRLAASAPARLAVYDVTGRLVRELFAGTAPAGETRVCWDGHDAAGAAMPPGVYLARLETGGRASSVRMLRIE